jgi:hypothetical protein
MLTLHRILTAPQRAAALAAVDTYRGNDFMGWRAEAEYALRTPTPLHSSQALRSLLCDLGGLAYLCEQDGSHHLNNRPTLAAECRGALAAIAAAYGPPVEHWAGAAGGGALVLAIRNPIAHA